MLRAGRAEGGDLDNALEGLARVFGRAATAGRVGPHFTCAEADRIARVLIVSRRTDAAIAFRSSSKTVTCRRRERALVRSTPGVGRVWR